MSMNGKGRRFERLGAVLALGCAIALNDAGAVTVDLDWTTVVNNADTVPKTMKSFNSYNQPSINDAGLVVFRARSQGGQGGPATGIFTRDMSTPGNPITPVAMRGDEVPAPNTVTKPGPATFNEFPSFPRIDANSGTVAFRGQSTPSVVTTLPDGSETRSGTSGVYATPGGGPLITGVRNIIPNGFPQFLVPNQSVPTKFDQFPGAPSPDGNIVTFKGNWTDSAGAGQTGVYFRDMVADGGDSPVVKVAERGERSRPTPCPMAVTQSSGRPRRPAPPAARWSLPALTLRTPPRRAASSWRR